jgi:hypothetical protein
VNDGVGVVGGAEEAGENMTAGGSDRTGAGGVSDGAVLTGADSNRTAGGG